MLSWYQNQSKLFLWLYINKNKVLNRLKRTKEELECFIINKAILLNQNNSFAIKNRNFALNRIKKIL